MGTQPNPLDIFDNQWLNSVAELGTVGVVALIVFFISPAIVALGARRRSTDLHLRVLCAALAGATLATPLCSLTFDSLSFPMFVNVYALVIGLTGACWRLAAAENESPGMMNPTAPQAPLRAASQQAAWFRPRRAES